MLSAGTVQATDVPDDRMAAAASLDKPGAER
jgi:hypothetical protein